MPVSFLPLIVPILLLGVPIGLFLARGRRAGFIGSAISLTLFGLLLLAVFAPGWTLKGRANANDPKPQYKLAKWTENHCDTLNEYLLWPCERDMEGGTMWLERSAGLDYPPALYALGTKLKHGPPMLPHKGQKFIDERSSLASNPL